MRKLQNRIAAAVLSITMLFGLAGCSSSTPSSSVVSESVASSEPAATEAPTPEPTETPTAAPTAEPTSVSPISNYKLRIQFCDGTEKIYNVEPLFDKFPAFCYLKDHTDAFRDVHVDVGDYGIIWNDTLDLSCDELWEHGETMV